MSLPADPTGTEDLAIEAYRLPGASLRLVPAPVSRSWMDRTDGRFAYRCLPLLLANQAGWLLLSDHRLLAIWDGNDAPAGLRIGYAAGDPPYPAVSHFGFGIVTWTIPYLFRTPPGYNLLVRGPANVPKEGATALEGLVETDWSVATFTMNWKITQANQPVVFEVDEPIAMLVPQKRGELEAFRTRLRDLSSNDELKRAHDHWASSRGRFLTSLAQPTSTAAKAGWQKDYFRGLTTEGSPAREHQTRLRLQGFSEDDADMT